MRLAELVNVSRAIGTTSRRGQKIALLAQALRQLAPAERSAGLHYLAGALPSRLHVGPAVTLALAVPPAMQPTLTIADVEQAFRDVAAAQGRGAPHARRQRLTTLLARATADEQDYLRRLLTGELRQGALSGLLLEALAQATGIAPTALRRAAMLAGDVVAVGQAVLTDGAAALARFRLQLFQPIQPMLAQVATDVADALARVGTAALEYKLDGARVQIHRREQEVRIYTRSLHDVTAALPEVVAAVRAQAPGQLIVDGEVIALSANGRPQPFQVTMRRFGRRQPTEAERQALPLSVFLFDCLHLDGEDLIDRPAGERLRRLEQRVAPALLVPRCVTNERAVAEHFLAQALADGHEGIMVKALDAPYEAGARGGSWLKLKSSHTLDLVVLAAEWGNGRRRGWLSNLHLGARDEATGELVMLGKTFKGMTDAMLAWQTERLKQLAVREAGHVVYVRPMLVVEIEFNELQASAQYPGGLALRFARVKRYRPDKSPETADTISTVRALYAHQSGHPAAHPTENSTHRFFPSPSGRGMG